LFTKENIELHISGIFNQKKVVIPWEKIRTKAYYSYFSIYSFDNPSEINRGYSYKDDWNTNVLYSVTRTLLKENRNLQIINLKVLIKLELFLYLCF